MRIVMANKHEEFAELMRKAQEKIQGILASRREEYNFKSTPSDYFRNDPLRLMVMLDVKFIRIDNCLAYYESKKNELADMNQREKAGEEICDLSFDRVEGDMERALEKTFDSAVDLTAYGTFIAAMLIGMIEKDKE